MLVSFSVKNYKSIYDEQTISFVANKIKNHNNHIIDKKDKILMYAGLYGPNASGKSNFTDALKLVKDILFRGTDFIEQFNFHNKDDNTVSSFSYIIKLKGKKYKFSYKINSLTKQIVNEELVDVTKKNEKIIYSRNTIDGTYIINPSIKKRTLFFSTLEEMKNNNQHLYLGELKTRMNFSSEYTGTGYDETSLVNSSTLL